jgi:prevent-host-death family protein
MKASVHEAKTHLSKLLKDVLLGEEVIITRSGRPVARLVPFEPRKAMREIGSAAGLFRTPDDFNEPLPRDLEDGFWQ